MNFDNKWSSFISTLEAYNVFFFQTAANLNWKTYLREWINTILVLTYMLLAFGSACSFLYDIDEKLWSSTLLDRQCLLWMRFRWCHQILFFMFSMQPLSMWPDFFFLSYLMVQVVDLSHFCRIRGMYLWKPANFGYFNFYLVIFRIQLVIVCQVLATMFMFYLFEVIQSNWCQVCSIWWYRLML